MRCQWFRLICGLVVETQRQVHLIRGVLDRSLIYPRIYYDTAMYFYIGQTMSSSITYVTDAFHLGPLGSTCICTSR